MIRKTPSLDEQSILTGFDRLAKSGVVLYDEKQETVEHVEGDLKFQFVLTSALAKKPTIDTAPKQAGNINDADDGNRKGSDISTRGFEIGDMDGDHFLIVNKFCFGRPHLMILTSDGHQWQYDPLRGADLAAAWTLLNAMHQDYVAFYNCGQDGGCRRLHKHLQLMPKPKSCFASFLDSDSGHEPRVPFQWFYHRFDSPHITPEHVTTVYIKLLQQATRVGQGLSNHAESLPEGAACPHNMILTKRWMVVLPRRRAAINKEAGVNALGMLGVIAVATRKEIDNWVRLGLTEAPRELGVPK